MGMTSERPPEILSATPLDPRPPEGSDEDEPKFPTAEELTAMHTPLPGRGRRTSAAASQSLNHPDVFSRVQSCLVTK